MTDRSETPQAASHLNAADDDHLDIIDPGIETGFPTAQQASDQDATDDDDRNSVADIDGLIARIRAADDPQTIAQINALLDQREPLEPSPVGVTIVRLALSPAPGR